MKARVWIDASMILTLTRRQIEILDILAGYGSGLAKAIVAGVTSQVSEPELTNLLQEIGKQTAPTVRVIQEAERKLRAGGRGEPS